MCGIQLKLLDGAHILPAKHPDSTDQTHNGIALCPLHHRSYDNALVTFDADFKTYLNGEMIDKLEAANLVGGLERFEGELRTMILLPPDRRDRPSKHFVELANRDRGWTL